MLNKSIEAHFTCFDIFHFLTTIKFKIQYVAHIVFILEGTGLEYCEKRDEKGDLLGGGGEYHNRRWPTGIRLLELQERKGQDLKEQEYRMVSCQQRPNLQGSLLAHSIFFTPSH